MSSARELERAFQQAYDRPRSDLESDWITNKGKPNHYRSHHTKHKGQDETGVRQERADKAAERARVLQVSIGGETDFIFNASSSSSAAEAVPASTDHEVAFEKLAGTAAPDEPVRVAAAPAVGVTFKTLPFDSAEALDDVNARVADHSAKKR